MINDPNRRNDGAIEAVVIEERTPKGEWEKSWNQEIKLIPSGSHGKINLWEVTIGTLESGGSVTMENGKLEIRENKGQVTYIGNRVNGEKIGTNNVVLVKENSGNIHTTIGTHISHNTGTMRITPSNENDFTVFSNTQTPDKKSAASLSVRIVSGKEAWAAAKVDSILEGEPKNEGLRVYYQDSSIDPMDGNEIFIDVNPDNTITLRQNDESMSAAEPVEITSGLKKLNVFSRPDMSWNGVILTCGTQELQINAKNGRIKDVFVRQSKTVG